MKVPLMLGAAAIVMVSCAAVAPKIELPSTLIGTVTSPRFTGWYVDYCNNGVLVRALPDCVQIGGEVYAVEFLRPRTLVGEAVGSRMKIAFPAHALPRHYRDEKRVELQRSPSEFAEETGIEYFAVRWDGT